MINILIPLAGKSHFFNQAEYPYPMPLIEVNDKTMIEHVVGNFNSIQEDKQFIFIVNSEDCKKYHIDNILKLATHNSCKIIQISHKTKGAACSALMSIKYINNDDPLIIANTDQIFDVDLGEIVSTFKSVDGGVITFDSIHPRWSYVRIDRNGFIVETAEKKPLSKHAVAGFYYFRKGKDFVESSMTMIKKDINTDGVYYVSPAFNEMILKNKNMITYKVDNEKYHTFYNPKKIKEYERKLECIKN
jgi:NDP-sugar pyrophosphorylase family protein